MSQTETPPEPTEAADAAETPRGGGAERRGVLRRVFRRPSTAVAFGFVVLLFLAAVAADLIMPFDPEDKDFAAILQGPSSTHLLGTDQFGQDIFSQLIAGNGVTLAVSLGSVGVGALIGVPFGLFLGYRGGWWDRLGSRALDISDALPGLLVAFAVIAVLGRSLWAIVFAIGVRFAAGQARLARAVTLVEREKEYIEAAQVSGLRGPEILFRQILPNLVVPLTAQASIMLGSAIIIESTLSFLNIGVEGTSWGGMLSDASGQLNQHPFQAFPPGLAIAAAVLSFNLVANGLSDVVGGTSVGVLRRATPRGPVAATPRPVEGPPSDDDLDHGVGGPGDGAEDQASALLVVRGLTVEVARADGDPVPIVEGASLTIGRGEVLGLLGESGSGKSMLARAVLGLLPEPTYLAAGSVVLDSQELTQLSERQLATVRGRQVAAVFQNPKMALSPVHTVGRQISEPLRRHFQMSSSAARERAIDLLDRVGVEHPQTKVDDYPHQFSGGMAQRVAIAMALAAEPKLLIADEATSALDVTTQSQVLDLLLDLQDVMGMSILMITHDLGVVSETCDRAAVMYAGQIMEVNDIASIFDRPQHPYTAALLEANPALDHDEVGRRPVIAGQVPAPGEWPTGCHFANRCAYAEEACRTQHIPLVGGVRCRRSDELAMEAARR